MKKLEGFGYFGDEDLLTCNPKLRKLLFRKRKKKCNNINKGKNPNDEECDETGTIKFICESNR